jgi:GNAT superfamily N-acetyltransferase
MRVHLKNNQSVTIRKIVESDADGLFEYLKHLSAESKSRFGPHAFDRATIDAMFDHADPQLHRYVATDALQQIVAYMLIKEGMIPEDRHRYANRNQFFDDPFTVTFAPSVADAWQSTGLGSAMNAFIEEELRSRGIKQIILWGGVQATNSKAVNFYMKHGYRYIASFWFDNKDNHDMIKQLQ